MGGGGDIREVAAGGLTVAMMYPLTVCCVLMVAAAASDVDGEYLHVVNKCLPLFSTRVLR